MKRSLRFKKRWVALAVCGLGSTPARGAVPETWIVPDPAAAPGGGVEIGASLDRGAVPPFRAGARDRGRALLQGAWAPTAGVVLDARADWIRDAHPDGTVATGPGDLELGVLAALPFRSGARRAAAALGWRAKLPDASDQGGLGSDEADVALLAVAALDAGPLRLAAAGGMAVLGNPLESAGQDDVPFLLARCAWAGGGPAVVPAARLEARAALASRWNPARVETALALGWGRRWTVAAEAVVGITPAAPDLGVAIRAGWGSGAWSPVQAGLPARAAGD